MIVEDPVGVVSPPSAEEPRLPLLQLRLLFLLNALSSTSWGRFGTIYYQGKQFSTLQIGIIEGTMPIVAVVFSCVWAMLADVYHEKKRVYLWTSLFGTMTLLLLAWDDLVRRSFIRILAISLGSKVFQSAGILDAYALDVLGSTAPIMYGRLRLWGSIGWGCGALAMGAINDAYGFEPNFGIFAGCNLAMIALLGCVVPGKKKKQRKVGTREVPLLEGEEAAPQVEVQQQHVEQSSKRELWELLGSFELVAFIGELFVFGACIGVVERLLFLYIVRDLRGDSTLCGLVVFVSSMCNIPVFHHAGSLLRQVGHARLMLLSQFCFFTRVFGYTLLKPETRYAILFLETLHGCTFAMLWIAAVDKARKIAPPGWNATLQALMQTTYYSLGPGVGALLGGAIWHAYSARVMYRVFAAAALVLFCIRLACLCCYSSHPEPHSPTVAATAPSSSSFTFFSRHRQSDPSPTLILDDTVEDDNNTPISARPDGYVSLADQIAVATPETAGQRDRNSGFRRADSGLV